tara:strand:- start:296 stop:430 length:135 start_codon:yes stop_codon:yes gene_type:complete
MEVLITGSSGFLGQEFVKIINKRKYILTYLGREKKKKKIIYFAI